MYPSFFKRMNSRESNNVSPFVDAHLPNRDGRDAPNQLGESIQTFLETNSKLRTTGLEFNGFSVETNKHVENTTDSKHHIPVFKCVLIKMFSNCTV